MFLAEGVVIITTYGISFLITLIININLAGNNGGM